MAREVVTTTDPHHRFSGCTSVTRRAREPVACATAQTRFIRSRSTHGSYTERAQASLPKSDESHMGNHIGVIRCSSCDRNASLVIHGMYMCSTHGLIVVLEQLEAPSAVPTA